MAECSCEYSDIPTIRAWSTDAIVVTMPDGYTAEDLAEAIMTLRYAGEDLVQMGLSSAALDLDTGALYWNLTQEQTGSLPVGKRVRCFVDLVDNDGKRGGPDEVEFLITESGVAEVIDV